MEHTLHADWSLSGNVFTFCPYVAASSGRLVVTVVLGIEPALGISGGHAEQGAQQDKLHASLTVGSRRRSGHSSGPLESPEI
jgi:hypothetical protein